MPAITVTEYDHFVSFSQTCEGERIVVQYRRDQVWLDEDGEWHVKDGQQPFYSMRSAIPRRPEVRLSPRLQAALGGEAGHRQAG